MFENIVGYCFLKKELENLYVTLSDCEKSNKEGIRMPKSLLLCGDPGNGKTLFIREFLALFKDHPVYYITNQENISKYINEVYDKAKKEDKLTFVVIDEIDLLVENSPSAERALLSSLDGVDNKGKVFTLAACNDINKLSDALTRKGRMDKIYRLRRPTDEAYHEIVEFFIKKYNIHGNLDLDYVCSLLITPCIADVEYVFMELSYLKRDVTNEDVKRKIEEVIEWPVCCDAASKLNRKKEDYKKIAIHELGHAVVAAQHKDMVRIYSVNIEEKDNALGGCYTIDKTRVSISVETEILSVDIALGGFLASRIISHFIDSGARVDLQRARQEVGHMVNYCGLTGIDTVLSDSIGEHYRPCSPFRLYQNEKRQMRFLRKRERIVSRIIKKNKDKILALADVLVEKKELSGEEVYKVFNA